MKRRISLIRNPGNGDVLENKQIIVKLDGWKVGQFLQGQRLVFDADEKVHTLTVSYKGELSLELNYQIPAGNDDMILALLCEGNQYTLKQVPHRELTIRRDDANPNLGLSLQIDGRVHPAAPRLDAGGWLTICIDTANHTLNLQGYGIMWNQKARSIKVPAGTGNEEYFVTVNADKTVTVKKKQPVQEKNEKKPQNPSNNILPGGLSDNKLRNALDLQLMSEGDKLFDLLYKNRVDFLRVEVGSGAISFNYPDGTGFRTGQTIFYTGLADKAAPSITEKRIVIDSQQDRNTILNFIRNYINSDERPESVMEGKDIYRNPEFDRKVIKKAEDIYGSSTTYHLKMEIKALLNPEHGEVYQWLKNSEKNGVFRVGFGAVDDCIVFDAYSTNSSNNPVYIKEIFYKDINKDADSLRQMAKMTGGNFPEEVNPFEFLETWEKESLINEILQQFINSDQCPGVYYDDHAIWLDPDYSIDVADSATMSFLKGDYLRPLFYLPNGILCNAMCDQNPPAEYIDVAVGTAGISFNGHFRGMSAGEVKTIFSVLWEDINDETVLIAAEKMKGIKGHGPVITRLDSQKDRDAVIQVIREYIKEEVTVAYMEGNRIYLRPEVNERPEHPDMNYSLTSSVLWYEMLDRFGEKSEFAERTKETPATCFVTAETDRLRINMMFEEEAGTTEVVEIKYSDCTFDKMPSSWEQLKITDWQNRFDRLDDPEDQKELVDYLMWMMDVFRHIIIEGNSFRTRRKGEEIIEVEQTLTGRMMARKVVKLFDLDGEFIDIMRHSDIKFCHIAGYKDYLAFIFNNTDGKVVKTIYRDFAELVDEEFLSGEDCFDHLTCGYEKDELSYFLGKAVGELPYMRTRSDNHLDSNILFLNRNMVPGLDEPYIPESAEVQPDIEPDTQPDVQNEWSVESAPTTLAVIAELNQQFGEGGGLARFMKDMGLNKAELMTGSHEIVIGFWKDDSCTSRISMQYAQYASGEEGAYQMLDEENRRTLQNCIQAAVPYLTYREDGR